MTMIPDSGHTCLALHGGPAVFPDGPPSWPVRDDEVGAALEAAWSDGSWGQYHGPHTVGLCDDLRDYFGRQFVSLCASGTIAVELALRGVGVQAGDEVVLAAYDFPGNFRAVEAIGARPVLVDIDPRNWCLDAGEFAEAMARQRLGAAGVRAVVVSHLHGGLAPMRAIRKTAERQGIAVVEDACQAPGATVEGHLVGTCGDVSVLSFGGSKLLSAGRGGALLTDNPSVDQRLRVFADRGNAAFPMSQLQAAVLRPQLVTLAARHRIRAERANLLFEATQHLGELMPLRNFVDGSPAFFKRPWLLAGNLSDLDRGLARGQFLSAMQAEGVAIDIGFRGFAKRSEKRCRKVGDLPHAVTAAGNTVLLHHPILLNDEETVCRVAVAFEKVLMASRQGRLITDHPS